MCSFSFTSSLISWIINPSWTCPYSLAAAWFNNCRTCNYKHLLDCVLLALDMQIALVESSFQTTGLEGNMKLGLSCNGDRCPTSPNASFWGKNSIVRGINMTHNSNVSMSFEMSKIRRSVCFKLLQGEDKKKWNITGGFDPLWEKE